MASRRLTQEMRRGIITKLLDKAFREEQEAVERERRAVGLELYQEQVPEKLRNLLATLPQEFVHYDQALRLSVEREGGKTNRLGELPLPSPKPLPLSGRFVVDEGHWAAKRVHELERWEADLSDRRHAFRREIEGVLAAFTTTKQLFEHWPEVEAFAPFEARDAEPKNLPVKDLAHLRQVTGELGSNPGEQR